jgi:hypothetical protein
MDVSLEIGHSVRELNTPGVLSRIADAIAQEGISIKGFTTPSQQETGCIRVYTEDPEVTRRALETFDFDVREEEYIVVDLEEGVGQLSRVTTPISEAKIDIVSAFGTVKGGESKVIFQTSANQKALRLIREEFR